ncbi:MAG: AraC family transcriptional regulator [Clostridia bacterium]|nr:AraC family transcriptional regulator [Clostridia bacterium]MBQ7037875.1 AraC family transcriptional regulator [Clostridia bacterium]
MELYLRYAADTSYLPNRFFTKAYDCRMLFILEGTGEIKLGDETYELKKNVLCYYPAGTRYLPISSTDDTLKFITLNFDFDTTHPHRFTLSSTVAEEEFCPEKALASHNGDVPELFKTYFVIQNAYNLRNIFLEIEQEYNGNERYGKEKAAAKLQYLCYCLPTYNIDINRELFNQILSFINDHLCTMQSNKELAQALNYHPYYLNKIFKMRTGISIHQYILKKRLEKSVQLLRDTNKSIAEIANLCGFFDQRHFSSLFSKKLGCTPSQTRKSGTKLL